MVFVLGYRKKHDKNIYCKGLEGVTQTTFELQRPRPEVPVLDKVESHIFLLG